LGLVTLVIFPIPTFAVLYFFEDVLPLGIFQFDNLGVYPIIIGLLLGIVYAFIALFVMQAKVFEKLPSRIEQIVKDMNLTMLDCIFLSICAGVGEELLFRSGVQFYLGPILTSVIFVAIHGYLNPWNWRMSLYGLIVLPFILLISYGFESMGLWFAITTHFAYDLVLFTVISESWKKKTTYSDTPTNLEVMKTMTCRELGGACDLEFQASTFEEMAELSKSHGTEMMKQNEEAHLKAMNEMKELMKTTEAMQEWFDGKRNQFNAL